MCKKNKILLNKRHGHFGAVKEYTNESITCVFMSTQEKDGKTDNIKMYKNPNPKEKDKPSYFMKRVRTYKRNTYVKPREKMRLSHKDKKLSDEIYKKHLKNKK